MQQERKAESAPKSIPEPQSKPLPAPPPNAPVVDASPITRQPMAEASTTPSASKSRAAAPAARQAAMADSSEFPSSAPDFIGLPPRVTYADLHKNDPVTNTGPPFPSSAPDFIGLPPKVTYADLHKNDPVTNSGPPLPSEAPEKIGLPPKVTYADLVGKKKADAACAACHGPEGSKPTTPETPHLAGLQYNYLVQALIEYRKGARDNAVMNAMAKALTENELRDLAWYFSRRQGLSTGR
jgi:cytochrome c553